MITIDLTNPENAAAFADCEVGDTKEIEVISKDDTTLTAEVIDGDYEDKPAEAETATEGKNMTGPPSKGLVITIGKR